MKHMRIRVQLVTKLPLDHSDQRLTLNIQILTIQFVLGIAWFETNLNNPFHIPRFYPVIPYNKYERCHTSLSSTLHL